MTKEDAKDYIREWCPYDKQDEIIKALEQEPIDISAMMYEIFMESVNMTDEYQGCWVRFKDIEKIVDKYMGGDKE